MSEVGQKPAFGDVGSMSGLPKSGHDWAIYEYTPELDAARRSRALSRAGSTARHARRRCRRAVTMPRSARAWASARGSTPRPGSRVLEPDQQRLAQPGMAAMG